MDAVLGRKAVNIARKTVDLWASEHKRYQPDNYPEEFRGKAGVFVTLHTYPERELRGCIGYPEPVLPLIEALISSAIEACQDPRFSPLERDELDRVVVEVSVLTKPELIESKPKDYPDRIELGKDGLIVQKGFNKGLLLPQVPLEHAMDKKDFLMHTCLKAGLEPTAWLSRECKVFKFSSEIFSEKRPKV